MTDHVTKVSTPNPSSPHQQDGSWAKFSLQLGGFFRSVPAFRAPIVMAIKQPNSKVHSKVCFESKRRVRVQVLTPHHGHSLLVFSQRFEFGTLRHKQSQTQLGPKGLAHAALR